MKRTIDSNACNSTNSVAVASFLPAPHASREFWQLKPQPPNKVQALSHAFLLATLAMFVGTPAQAGDSESPKHINPTIDPMLVAAGFLDSHPDLLHRSRGLESYGEREYPEAIRHFKRAASYGDKPSQAIIGEMLWIGQGAALDRVLAYIWMELAAERGYISFVGKRDMYWSQLDERERARAHELKPAFHSEYADEVTEPRLAQVLLREKRSMTGSRLGSTSSPVQIVVPGVGTIDSSQYYDPKYWDPVQYRQWQDAIWTNIRIGRVNVGEVQQVRDPTTPEVEQEQGAEGQEPPLE